MDRPVTDGAVRHRSPRRLGRRRLSIVLAALAMALVAAGCGGSDTTTGGGSSEALETLEPTVLSGEAMTVDGETFDLGTLADKDLVIWFWAPW